MSNPRDVDAPPSPKKPRTVEKREYLVEVPHDASPGWMESPDTGLRGPFDSTQEAQKAIRENGSEGKYRVVRVCWSGEVKTETKKVTRLT